MSFTADVHGDVVLVEFENTSPGKADVMVREAVERAGGADSVRVRARTRDSGFATVRFDGRDPATRFAEVLHLVVAEES